MRQQVCGWFESHRASLAAIDPNTRPNDLINCLGDDLLHRFQATPLLDPYDVYEQLLTYWHETMHDDVALIMADGWVGAARPRLAIEDKERKLSETPDLVIGSGKQAVKYKMDLILPRLIVDRYFADEQAKLDELNLQAEEATRAVEEYTEEHAVEDGLLAAAMEDDKITKALASARLKEAKREGSDPEEVAALQHLIKLYDAEAGAKKAAKDAQAALDQAILKQSGSLTDNEVKAIVLDEKWHSTIENRVIGEVNALTLSLVARIQELGQRYEMTLEDLDASLDQIGSRREKFLAEMGVLDLLTGQRRLPGFTKPWSEVRLGEHVTFLRTIALSRAQLNEESPLKYLHYGDIHTTSNVYLDAVKAPMPRAPLELAKSAGRLQVGDLVFVDASEDPDGVGKAIEVVCVPAGGVVAGLHTIAARFDKSILADGFKAYLQFMPDFRTALLRLAAGTKVLATTKSHVSSIVIALPSIEEQIAITEALRNATNESRLLRLRLAKAEAIKQGMMQELLAGRTRLPAMEAT